MSSNAKEHSMNDRIVFTRKLLTEVKNRPYLWRKTDPLYKNRTSLRQAWAEIGKAVSAKAKLARLRWKGLRDVFQKELKRIQKHHLEGGDVKDLRLWMYFRDMLFLKEEYADPSLYPTIQVKEQEPEIELFEMNTQDAFVNIKTEDLESSDDCSSDIQDKEYLNELSAYAGSETDIARPTLDSKFSMDHMIEISDTPIVSITADSSMAESSNCAKKRKIQYETHTEDTSDEDMLFVRSLVPYFKGLDPVRKLRLQSKIQNLIADELQDFKNYTH